MSHARTALWLASSGLIALSSPATAQTAPTTAAPTAETAKEGEPAPGDIIVTAQRTAQSLNRVPLSISAFSREKLDDRGIRDFSDVIRQTPGLVFERSNTTTNISVRGVNSSVGAATTGIYIDDVPIQIRQLGYGGGNVYPVVFDLDRIEVLRGPQGTLFGAGSEGGTVRFITVQPNLNRFGAYGRAELAGTERGGETGEIGVGLGGPIVKDKLAVQASGNYRRDGGYVDRINPFTGALIDRGANRTDSVTARIAATWQPVAALKITPSFFFQQINANDSGESWEVFSNYPNGVYRNGNPVREWSNDKFYLSSLNISYDFGGAQLIGVGSYFDRSQRFQQDYTTFDQTLFTGVNRLPFFPDQRAPSYFQIDQKNWTGELRLQSTRADSRLTWVVGAFYTNAQQTSIQQVTDPYLPVYLFGGPAPVPGFSVYDQNAVSTDEQFALFGQASYKVQRRLSLTVGLRYSHTLFTIRSVAQGFVVGPTVDDRGRQTEDPVNPKFGVDFQVTPRTLLYFSASRGFRVGGYNPQVGTFCGPELNAIGFPNGRPTNYRSDSVWSYELGLKSRFWGERGNVQASVYQIDWNNIQQPVALNSCGFQFTSNLGSARSRGFDLQLEVKPAERLTLQTEVGYVDAVFLDTIRGGPTATAPFVSAGDAIIAPPWTVSAHAQYDFDLFRQRDLYLRTDFDFRARQTARPPFLNPNNGAIDPALNDAFPAFAWCFGPILAPPVDDADRPLLARRVYFTSFK